jgi:hypothetical protein
VNESEQPTLPLEEEPAVERRALGRLPRPIPPFVPRPPERELDELPPVRWQDGDEGAG